MLGAAGDLRFDAGIRQGLDELLLDVVDVGCRIASAFLELLAQDSVGDRIDVAKRQVFQFRLELPDPETVGQRGVNLECLVGDAGLLLRWQGAEGAHVVEPVGEFDEHDPDVVDHGQEHLAQVLRLLRFFP